MKKVLSFMIALLMFSVLLLPVNAAEDYTSEPQEVSIIYLTDGVVGGQDSLGHTVTYTLFANNPNKISIAVTFPLASATALSEYMGANGTKVNGVKAEMSKDGLVMTLVHEALVPLTSGEFEIELIGMSAPKYTQKIKFNVTVPNSGNGEDAPKTTPLNFYYCTNGEVGGVEENKLAGAYNVSGNTLVLTIYFPADSNAIDEYVSVNASKVNGKAVTMSQEGKVLTLTYVSDSAITSGEYEVEFVGVGAPTYTQKTFINVEVEGEAGGNNGSPNTFDAITLVGAIALLSAAGVVVSKKKR